MSFQIPRRFIGSRSWMPSMNGIVKEKRETTNKTKQTIMIYIAV